MTTILLKLLFYSTVLLLVQDSNSLPEYSSFPSGAAEFNSLKWRDELLDEAPYQSKARFSRAKRDSSRRSDTLFDSAEADYDDEDKEIMGALFTQFLADSDSQLVLDLDLFRQIIALAQTYRNATESGHMDIVRFFIKIVEKMKSFDISAACVADVFHFAWTAVEYATQMEETKNCTDCKCTPYFQQHRDERHWIFNVLDALGKVPSGITSGNNLWVGSYETCRKVSVVKNVQGQKWNGQYCLTHVMAYEKHNPFKSIGNSGPPDEHCYSNNTAPAEPSEDDGKCFTMIPLINFGICVPDTCTDYDATRMVTMLSRVAESFIGQDLVCDVHVECRRDSDEQQIRDTPLAKFALYFLILTIIMMVFGTLYDVYVHQEQLRSLPITEQKTHLANSHLFIRVIMPYSVYRNGVEILKTEQKEGEIDCLHGIRFLSMCWIILGHTYYYIGSSLTTDNLIPTLINFPKMFYTQVIVQAPLAVDSFFFLSGLLTAYLFCKMFLKSPPGKRIPKPWSPMIWAAMYIKRYTRITPVYAVIMLFDVTLFTTLSSGPFWRPIERQGCRIAWWTNFIYLNNFLLQDEECCMGWTWYLANDMQLQYVVAPILLILIIVGARWGYLAAGLMTVASSIIHMIIVVDGDYPPAPLLTAKLQIVKKLDSYWNYVYVRPYMRCTPFIIGVLVGYFLNRFTKGKKGIEIDIPKKWVIVGWSISTVLGLYSVFGLYEFARTGDISEFWKYLYVLFGRPAYAVSLGWVAFACATGNGGPVNKFLSWKFFIPLSRITFCAYLLHPIMLQVYNFSRPQPFHIASFTQMLRHTFEAIFVSYLMAFFFALAFEKPFTAFDEMLIPIKRGEKTNLRRQTSSENGHGENGVANHQQLNPEDDQPDFVKEDYATPLASPNFAGDYQMKTFSKEENTQ